MVVQYCRGPSISLGATSKNYNIVIFMIAPGNVLFRRLTIILSVEEVHNKIRYCCPRTRRLDLNSERCMLLCLTAHSNTTHLSSGILYCTTHARCRPSKHRYDRATAKNSFSCCCEDLPTSRKKILSTMQHVLTCRQSNSNNTVHND